MFGHDDVAELLAELTDQRVRYEPVTRDEWRADLEHLARTHGENVVNPAMAQHISAVGHMVSQSGRTLPADGEALKALIGRAPITLREFLEANLDAFTGRQPA